jgi:hypothetical protein
MWACHVGVTDVENFARSNMQKVIGIDDKTPVIFLKFVLWQRAAQYF